MHGTTHVLAGFRRAVTAADTPMHTLRKCAAVVGFAGFVISAASFAHVDSKVRLAFDNNGYPPDIGVQLWLDDAFEEQVTRATCTIDHCETTPMVMSKGRHQIRLRVLVDNKTSPFTVMTIER